MPGWAYTVLAIAAILVGTFALLAGRTILGLLGIAGAVVYKVGFQRWDETAQRRASSTHIDQS